MRCSSSTTTLTLPSPAPPTASTWDRRTCRSRRYGPGRLPVSSSASPPTTRRRRVRAEKDGAGYVAVGSIFPTGSKETTRPASPERLREVKQAVGIPVVAIGGINEENIAQVLEAGADAVAVISAVCGAEDVEEAAHRLAAEFGRATEKPAGTETSRTERGKASLAVPSRIERAMSRPVMGASRMPLRK